MGPTRSRNVEIRIFLIAETKLNRDRARAWLDDLGATSYQLPAPEAATDAAVVAMLAAKQCYLSFEPGLNPNVTRVRDDIVAYLDNILASGHGSVLEHITFTFAINGVSRVFTGEMNRHRAGWAISERSMRYIRFGDCIEWWQPPCLEPAEQDDPALAHKKARTLEIFNEAFSHQSAAYAELVALWGLDDPGVKFHTKKEVTSCIRRIIGMGVATGGVWTGNVRALRHVLALRTSPEAEEEIAHVFCRVAAIMVERVKELFGDFERVGESSQWKPKYPKV